MVALPEPPSGDVQVTMTGSGVASLMYARTRPSACRSGSTFSVNGLPGLSDRSSLRSELTPSKIPSGSVRSPLLTRISSFSELSPLNRPDGSSVIGLKNSNNVSSELSPLKMSSGNVVR